MRAKLSPMCASSIGSGKKYRNAIVDGRRGPRSKAPVTAHATTIECAKLERALASMQFREYSPAKRGEGDHPKVVEGAPR
jgi:hypothetical protein